MRPELRECVGETWVLYVVQEDHGRLPMAHVAGGVIRSAYA